MVRWNRATEGQALWRLFETNAADPHNCTTDYIRTVHLANPAVFGAHAFRNFSTNYRRYSAEYLVELDMAGARRAGAAPAAAPPARRGRGAAPAPIAARRGTLVHEEDQRLAAAPLRAAPPSPAAARRGVAFADEDGM
jgi:hypothetical protein